MGKKLLAENISRTGVCVCVMTRWEPGVRQESFIQGVKMANLCGRKTPLLILSFVWCFSVSQGRDPCGHSSTRTFEGRFCRDSFFSTSPLNFFFSESAVDKIRKYRADYNNNTPTDVSFMTTVDSTSGRLHSEFV